MCEACVDPLRLLIPCFAVAWWRHPSWHLVWKGWMYLRFQILRRNEVLRSFSFTWYCLKQVLMAIVTPCASLKSFDFCEAKPKIGACHKFWENSQDYRPFGPWWFWTWGEVKIISFAGLGLLIFFGFLGYVVHLQLHQRPTMYLVQPTKNRRLRATKVPKVQPWGYVCYRLRCTNICVFFFCLKPRCSDAWMINNQVNFNFFPQLAHDVII